MKKSNRDQTIDIMRGVAIVLMVAAHQAGYLMLTDNVSLIFRFFASLAAPIFVLLAGMMVARKVSLDIKLNYSSYVKRAGVILLIASTIDVVIHGDFPFITFDILYLIGFSMLLMPIYSKLNKLSRYLWLIMILLLTPVVQMFLGYEFLLQELNINSAILQISLSTVLHHLFVDGWFPLFPWLAVVFIGYEFGLNRWNKQTTKNLRLGNWVFLSAMLTINLSMWLLFNSFNHSRVGDIELFYPPSVLFILAACSLTFLGIKAIDNLNIKSQILSRLGSCSLLLYISHLAMLALFLDKYVVTTNTFYWSVGLIIHIIFLYLISIFADRIRKSKINLIYPVKVIIGD